MRKFLKVALVVTGVTVVLVGGLAYWALRQTYPSMPALTGRFERGTLQHGGRERSWREYVPVNRAAAPALVIVLHSSMANGSQVREMFGYDFDVLADRRGFVVAYPNGYEGHWNEARLKGPFSAKQENVDDVGFLHALVDDFAMRHSVDRSRVFVTGVSNGGSMVIRLALETPGFARAYAAVAASLPASENMAARPAQRPVSMLIMNGSGDPLNPFNGGDVVLRGVWGNRGRVLSTHASIDYFRGLAGIDTPPFDSEFPDRDPSDGTTVGRSVWSAHGKPWVVLYTVRGGGHDVPHPATFTRRLLGRSNRDIHAAHEIWEFFDSAP